MTRFSLHVENWKDCQRCELASGRKHVVIARGSVPCDVVFIGEAPGVSEDVSGTPFVGPAGHLLDAIIRKALQMPRVPDSITHAITNLVGCFPAEAKRTADHKPPDEAVKACAPRVSDFIDLCDPKLVVAVGKLAVGWLDSQRRDSVKLVRPVPVFEIMHPSAILHANVAVQGLLIQKAVVTLGNAIASAMSGTMKVGPVERVLKPKAKDIKPRSPTARKVRIVQDDGPRRTSTFSPGTVGPPPSRCHVCKRPAPRPAPGGKPLCSRPECQPVEVINEDGTDLPF